MNSSGGKKRSRHFCRLPVGQEREGVPSAQRRIKEALQRMSKWSETVNYTFMYRDRGTRA